MALYARPFSLHCYAMVQSKDLPLGQRVPKLQSTPPGKGFVDGNSCHENLSIISCLCDTECALAEGPYHSAERAK